MAKKVKKPSPKEELVSKIENTLTESLTGFPKKHSEKKFKKTLHKAAGKIVAKSVVTKTKKAKAKVKKSPKKSSPKKEKLKEQTA